MGKQWRFLSNLVETWLTTQIAGLTAVQPIPPLPPAAPISALDFADLLPLPCAQLIQDTFDALGVMLVLADIEDRPVTQVSLEQTLLELNQKFDKLAVQVEFLTEEATRQKHRQQE